MKYILIFLSFSLFSCGNTFYIVRHAEKAPVEAGASQQMTADPPLSEAGNVRAIDLREVLSTKDIRHIFSTNFKRTISTAQPLNELEGRTHIEIYSSRRDSMDAFIEKLKSIKKGNVLVVGHSNTIDDLANKLCGKSVVAGDLDERIYDNLFIIKRMGNRFSFLLKKYGVPSKE